MTPARITLSGLSAATPDNHLLFDDLTLTFGAERTGIVGRNGVGKTTLLRIILRQLLPAQGTLSANGRFGVLDQIHAPKPGDDVAALMGVDQQIACLRPIEAGLCTEEDLNLADWGLEVRLETALRDLGLQDLDLARPAASLSGGQITRAVLAGLMALAPDMLVLDEPTNNLDRLGRQQVAQMLKNWSGGAVVVSHDREVLRQMDRILDLSGPQPRLYGGNYDAYRTRKDEEAAAARLDLVHAKKEVSKVARDTQVVAERNARRDAAGRRAKARGDQPKIVLNAKGSLAEASSGKSVVLADRLNLEAAARLQRAEARVERITSIAFELEPTGLPAGRTLIALEGVEFGWPGQSPLFSDLNLKVKGPERLALTGPNGAGKSSLISLLMGNSLPTKGRVTLSARAACLDQQASILGHSGNLVDAFRRINPAATENRGRQALARFLFRNVMAEKSVSALSGGERLRAALACLLLGDAPPQLLILDEPTNHLDLESIEALEAILRDYDGSLIVASHDEDFLRALGIQRQITLTGQVPGGPGWTIAVFGA